MALLIREQHVHALLTMPEAIAVLEEAFLAFAQGLIVNQLRDRLSFSTGVLNYLAAAAPEYGVSGYKTYTTSRAGVRSLVMLFSAADGQLLALLESEWLGAMRTGAASALATRLLSRPESHVVGMIGTGMQAMTQLIGICEVRSVRQVFVYSRDKAAREYFCQMMARRLNVAISAVDTAQQAVEFADILVTATTAKDPVLFGEWLRPGCHINAIGSNWAERRELDTAAVQKCDLIVTDSLEQAKMEAGDLLIPATEGHLDWEKVTELSAIVSGNAPRRTQPNEITLFKGLGIALEDIATAAHIYTLASQQGVGDEIDLLS
jgi:ornithine cyclodeaminase/alanine dehydrogenase-like protein (mu-crystallin family)